MVGRRVTSDETVRTFRIASGRRDFVPGSKPRIVDDSEICNLYHLSDGVPYHGGFKKKLLDVQTDNDNMVVGFYAVIEIYYVPPSYEIFDKNPLMLGTVTYSGSLEPARTQFDQPKWNTQILVVSLYGEANAEKLPLEVQRTGPGALMTAVIQGLFGTQEGIQLLGLGDYKVPDTEAGLTDIKIKAQ